MRLEVTNSDDITTRSGNMKHAGASHLTFFVLHQKTVFVILRCKLDLV